MEKDQPNRLSPADEGDQSSYWSDSKRPLQILIFLLPLVVLYEIGLALLLRSEGGIITNKAHESLLRFFDAFGINAGGGLFLGGLAIIVVLLLWHLLKRDPWTVHFNTIGLMALESIALILPLLVLGRMIRQFAEMTAATAAIGSFSLMTPPPTELADLGIWSGTAISVGAGLYEELLFRMMLIAALHTMLVDVGKLSQRLGVTIALVVSAAAFAIYHPLTGSDGTFSIQKLVFYFTAGLYFGVVYFLRGFGIVVAVHAFYDVLTVAVINGDSG